MNYQIDKIVNQIERLPTRNHVAFEVIQLCADPNSTVNQLKSIISSDQVLTSQILRIANSSYFNYPRTIHSIERAIVILGFNLIRDIAISIAIYSFYKGFRKSSVFDLRYIWRHALLSGIIGRTLGKKYDPQNQSLFYVGCLLHDIGKLVESRTMNEDFDFLLEKSHQEGLRLDVVEKKFLNFHHGQVGGKLLEKWNLPEELVQMAIHHHDPSQMPATTRHGHAIRVAYLSNILAHYIQDGMKGLETILQYDANFTRHFRFTEEEFQELITTVQDIVEENQVYFDILQV